jgi:hypothetical protein
MIKSFTKKLTGVLVLTVAVGCPLLFLCCAPKCNESTSANYDEEVEEGRCCSYVMTDVCGSMRVIVYLLRKEIIY